MKAHIMTKNETSEFLLAKTISSLEYITSNFSSILFLKTNQSHILIPADKYQQLCQKFLGFIIY